MNLAELTTCIQKGETLHTEFKQWPLHPDDMAAAVVAFANTDGGRILLGVNDQGQVVGIDENERDRVARTVDNVAYNNIEPPATVVIETVADEQGRNVLVVNVPKGSQRPYRTNRGLYFVRTASGKRQASREELLRLFQAVKSLYYDEVPLLHSSLADIEAQARDDLLRMVAERGIDLEGIEWRRILLNWHLLHQSNDHLSLTIAGALFLARQPQRLLPMAHVSALRIPGDEISIEPSDQKRIEGRMLDVLEDSLRFLHIHLPRPHRIHGLDPEWQNELPEPLLREAMVNALAHRDYTVTAPIRLLIFDDRIEIHSPGKLPNGVTLEGLPLGVHAPRNPMIYTMLLRLGLVTDAGAGIPRIIRLTRQATGREPDLRADDSEFILSLPRRKPDSSS